ncbi:translation initiation factor eIF 1A [Echinococcus multilocularis]|uniref:Eukaryotic translation initiation factor 4C n=1 Tax=Echinococcus multilocularis TaxID=6211 RepID=A0A087W044_ECHMU|nr:translation initiation factor eIF 1A [Echinococcus multilocularis]
MPKNKGKGGKNRRRGKNENEGQKRALIYREEGQQYAKVERLLGNGRLEAYCFDGVKRLCHIRGKMRKKVWINSGDIILVSLRDYQDQKADVILKYLNDEARTLKSIGEIPDTVNLDENDDIEFDANAAMPDDDLAVRNSYSDMPPSSSEEESSEDEEDDDEEEDGDEGAPFGSHVHYKGEFAGNRCATGCWLMYSVLPARLIIDYSFVTPTSVYTLRPFLSMRTLGGHIP